MKGEIKRIRQIDKDMFMGL